MGRSSANDEYKAIAHTACELVAKIPTKLGIVTSFHDSIL